jgi:hypothetical protein
VRDALDMPPGAQLAGFTHYEYAAGRTVARIEWHHVHNGLPVDGDYLWAIIHPDTRRIIEWSRRWRQPHVS